MAQNEVTKQVRKVLQEAINHCDTYNEVSRILEVHHIKDTPEEFWTLAAALQDLSDEFAELAQK